MNGLGNLTRRVLIDIGTMPEYKYAKEELGISKETIRSMRNGMPVSLRIVQRFADRVEIPGPSAFTDPFSEIENPKADLAFIPVNIERVRRERGMTIQDLASATCIMSAGKLEKIENSVILATTVELQALADALEVDILELTVPPRSKARGDAITHKTYLPFNARIHVNRIKLRNNRDIDLDNVSIFKITRGVDSVRIAAVEAIADLIGLGIADMFVKPGVETEWYHETKAAYFAENMMQEMETQKISQAKMAQSADISKNTVANIKNGQMPAIKTAQAIADALSMEIGDLFLPPEI